MLVIACANLAGVLLARGVVRRREIAVRTAIGAGRGRVVRQLLTETTLLFALGGIAGLLLARALTSLLVTLLPAFPLPVNVSVPLDGRVVAFSLGISFSRPRSPAWFRHSTPQNPRSYRRSRTMPRRRRIAYGCDTVCRRAGGVQRLLVIAAAILVRDVDRVTSVDRGFDSRQVDMASVDLSMAGYTATTGSAFRAS